MHVCLLALCDLNCAPYLACEAHGSAIEINPDTGWRRTLQMDGIGRVQKKSGCYNDVLQSNTLHKTGINTIREQL